MRPTARCAGWPDGLGLADNRLELPVSALSGGERRRVELARILFAGSDVLLLDEPTNHLDIDAKEWLLDFMRGYSGALIVISHDLELLDEAITRIIHLERPDDLGAGSLTEYKGTYSQYLKSAGARRAAAHQGGDPAGERDQPPEHAGRLDARARPPRGPARRRASTPGSRRWRSIGSTHPRR